MPDLEGIPPVPEAHKEASGPHWSKDYVEHLRTVHFSLIALSLAALVLAMSPNPDEVKKAREQINAIGEVARSWNHMWLEQAAEQAVDNYKKELDSSKAIHRDFASGFIPEPKDANAPDLRDQGAHQITCGVHFATPNWLIAGPVRDLRPELRDAVFSFRQISLSEPKTLEEFRNLWNALNERHSIRLPFRVSKEIYGVSRVTELTGKKIGRLEWVRLPPEILVTKCTVNLDLVQLRNRMKAGLPSASDDLAYAIVSPFQTQTTTEIATFIPVTGSDGVSFKPQEGLIQRFGKDRPLGGSFEHSFPN
jgi:hypothetical protein